MLSYSVHLLLSICSHLPNRCKTNNIDIEKKEKKRSRLEVSYALWLIQSRTLILRSDQMSTGSTPQSSPRLQGLSAEEARQIPYTIVQTLSILDFLRIRLIRFGGGTVLLGTVIPGSKRRFGIDSTFHI